VVRFWVKRSGLTAIWCVFELYECRLVILSAFCSYPLPPFIKLAGCARISRVLSVRAGAVGPSASNFSYIAVLSKMNLKQSNFFAYHVNNDVKYGIL